jgi:hypothetical protein
MATRLPRQPDWLSTAEANALASELSRRVAKIQEGPVRQNIAEAMRVARIRPTMINAYLRTGLLVTEATRDGYSDEELRVWEEAVRREETE